MAKMQEKPKKTNPGHERCLEEHGGGSRETSEEGICEKSHTNILGVVPGLREGHLREEGEELGGLGHRTLTKPRHLISESL